MTVRRQLSIATGRLCLSLAVSSGIAVTASAADEAAPAVAQVPESSTLEEITVTAQKRSENIQNIPISISALSANELAAAKIQNYEDLTRATPGVSFNTETGSEGMDNIVIRGVSSTSGSATVGLYIDDVSITTKNFFDGAAQPRLFDLDHVEVLRGPQGTLYGTSSEGGTIRFVTKQPDLEKFSGEVTSDISGTKHGGLNYLDGGILNIPIVPDKAAIRISVSYEHDSGYINHLDQQTGPLVPGELTVYPSKNGVNTEGDTMIHLNGKIVINDTTTISPSIFTQHTNTSDVAAFYPSVGLWEQNKEIPEWSHDTLFLPSITINHDFGFANLTSVTGWFFREFDRQEDGTYYNSTAFAEFYVDPAYPAQSALTDSVIANLPSPVKSLSRYSQLSQELRLSSHTPGEGELPLKWVVGLFYQDQLIHNRNFQQIPGINQAFMQVFGFPIEQSLVAFPGIPQDFPDSIDEADEKKYDERQYAVFGQADYDILKDLHVGFGARFLRARDAVDFTTLGYYQWGNVSPFIESKDQNQFTPKFTLAYDINQDSKLYTSAAKGNRLGGPEASPVPFGPTTVCAQDEATFGVATNPLNFKSDSLWTYELGSKNRFADDKVSFNIDGYYTKWNNIQQQIYFPTCGYFITQNIGDAEIYGGEMEANYRPLRGLTFGVNAALQHATITKTFNPLTATVGEHLVDVPDATVSGSAEYDFPLNATLTFTARADYTYTGHSYGSYETTNSNFFNPSYGVVNASMGVETDRWTLSVYAKNLNDNKKIIQSPQINTVIEAYTLRPMTIGATAVVKF
jgi:outer membrane receptor protein involved in Fe transport